MEKSQKLTLQIDKESQAAFYWLCHNKVDKDFRIMDLFVGPTRYGKNVNHKVNNKYCQLNTR